MTLSLDFGILFLGALQFFFLTGVLAADTAQYKTANRYLMLFFLTGGIVLGSNVVLNQPELFPPWAFSGFRALVFSVLYASLPFLHLYIDRICGGKKEFGYSQAVHFIPVVFGVAFAYTIAFTSFKPTIELIQFWNGIFYIQAIVYCGFGMRKIINCKVSESDKFHSLSIVTRNWLIGLVGVFLFTQLISFASSLMILFASATYEDVRVIRLTAFFLVFLFGLGITYTFLKFPDLIAVKPGKVLNPKLPKSVNDETAVALRKLMEKERPYLNPDLKASDVAEKLGVHPRTLSVLLKHTYEMNFSDFINSYRVLNAQELILSDTSNKTMFEILLDSGFNSKSVFNAAFKKHTGMTPSEYRRKKAA
jgi:AraC-like DNA-binding protein